MSSSIRFSPFADSCNKPVDDYETRLDAINMRLEELELAGVLIEHAYHDDIKGAIARMNAAPKGLILSNILTAYVYRTHALYRKQAFEGSNPFCDLFFHIWLIYDVKAEKLTLEITEEEALIPEKLLDQYEKNRLCLTKRALGKLIDQADRPLMGTLFSRLKAADKAIVIDLMDEEPYEFIAKEEAIDIIEALEKMESAKTVRFISALSLNAMLELKKLRTPLQKILSRCLFIPDLLRLKKMGTSKERFIIESVPYDDEGAPFVKQIYRSIDSEEVNRLSPILLILCLNHGICLDPILPYLNKSTTDIYAQIPFIAAFGARTPVFNLFRFYQKNNHPTHLYCLLKSLDVERRTDDDCLSLQETAISINKTIKKAIDRLSSCHEKLQKRNLKAGWSPEEIEELDCFHDRLKYMKSLHFDAMIAPFFPIRARPFLTNDIAKVKRLCEDSEILLRSLMQYEDKKAYGVYSSGRKGRSNNRVPIVWKV